LTRRPAYTLLELMVALGSASVLMVGLSSALFIASQGLKLDHGASASRGRADAVVGRLLADARTATRYRSVTPTAVEFDVADRTGDGAADRLRYAWSGVAGSPLTRSLNGNSAVTLLPDVRALSFGSTTRAVVAQNVMTTALNTNLVFWSQATPTAATGVTSLTLTTPSKVVPGDLLIAMVASTGEQASLTAAGWTELCYATNNSGNKLRLSVWQRTALPSEPTTHSWYWPNPSDAIGGVVLLSNHDPQTPVAVTGRAIRSNQKANNPLCPTATVVRANSLVLRLGAFDKNNIPTDVSGLSGHTTVWAQHASSVLSAAWGYLPSVSAGTTGTANFALNNAADYATITIVVSPQIPLAP